MDVYQNGKPAQALGMTCEYGNCKRNGRDYQRPKGKDSGWDDEPIYLCEDHAKELKVKEIQKSEKITAEQFERLFKVKPFRNQYNCFGTWNGLDMSELGDSADNSRIAMWEKLKLNNWI